MVLITSRIDSKEIFPPDYKIYQINENILLKYSGKEEYYRITNRNHIPFLEKIDNTNWLLAAGAEYPAGDITDWLEPLDDELMLLALSVYSDRNMEVRVNLPPTDQQFGTKENPDTPITPEISPWKEPRVTIGSFGTTYVPSFKIKNTSEYKNLCMKLGVSGYRYKLEKIAKPERFDIVDLDVIR